MEEFQSKKQTSESYCLPPPIPRQNLEEAKWLAANLKSGTTTSPDSSQDEEVKVRSLEVDALPLLQPFYFDDKSSGQEDFPSKRMQEYLQDQLSCDGPQWEALKTNCDNSSILAEADNAIQSLRSWREKRKEEFSMVLEQQLAEIDDGSPASPLKGPDEADELLKRVEEQLSESNTRGESLQSLMQWHQEQGRISQKAPKVPESKEFSKVGEDEKLEKLQKEISALRIKKMIHDFEISAQEDGNCLQRNETVLNEELEFGIGASNMEENLREYSNDLDRILQQIEDLENTCHHRKVSQGDKENEAP